MLRCNDESTVLIAHLSGLQSLPLRFFGLCCARFHHTWHTSIWSRNPDPHNVTAMDDVDGSYQYRRGCFLRRTSMVIDFFLASR